MIDLDILVGVTFGLHFIVGFTEMVVASMTSDFQCDFTKGFHIYSFSMPIHGSLTNLRQLDFYLPDLNLKLNPGQSILAAPRFSTSGGTFYSGLIRVMVQQGHTTKTVQITLRRSWVFYVVPLPLLSLIIYLSISWGAFGVILLPFVILVLGIFALNAHKSKKKVIGACKALAARL